MRSKAEVTDELVRLHFAADEDTSAIYVFPSPDGEPIRLLEVTPATVATGQVDVFGFAPFEDISFPLAIAIVAPEELDQIRQGRIELPGGWSLDEAEVRQREAA
jgi:hypothetical protein